MKVVKHLFFYSVVFSIFFGILLTFSGVQKFLLKSFLKHRFGSVSLNYVAIKWAGIKLEGLELEAKDQKFFIKNLEVQWNLWDLLKLRGFNLKSIHSEISIDGSAFVGIAKTTLEKSKAKRCLAASDLPFLRHKALNGLLPLIQWPLKLWIGEVNIQITGKEKAEQAFAASITGGALAPQQNGIFKWAFNYDGKNSPLFTNGIGSGHLFLSEDIKGRLCCLQFDGEADLYKNNQPISIKGIFKSERISNSTEINESFYGNVLVGNSSELETSGHFLRNNSKKVDLKWHLNMDNALSDLFWPEKLPSYLVTFGGQISVMRGSNALNAKATLEGWVKNLQVLHKSLKTTPPLRFKCEGEGRLDKKIIKLSMLRLTIKNAKTEENFFKGYLLHPLNFNVSQQQLCALKKDTRIFEGTLFALPLNLANPILTPYNIVLDGPILGHEFGLSWIEKEKVWEIASEQPLAVKPLSVDVHHQPWLTDVNFKINPKLTLDQKGERAGFDIDLELLDHEYSPLISSTLTSQIELKSWQLQNLNCWGNLHANLQNISGQPFWMLLTSQGPLTNPLELISKHKLAIDFKKNTLMVNSLKIKVEDRETTFANLELQQEVSVNLKDLSKITLNEGDIFNLYLKSLPLKIFSPFSQLLASVNLQGVVGYEGCFSKEKENISLNTIKPFTCKNFSLYVGQNLFCIPYMQATPKLLYKPKNISAQIEKLYCEGTEKNNHLEGNFSCNLEKESEWQIRKAIVDAQMRWDECSLSTDSYLKWTENGYNTKLTAKIKDLSIHKTILFYNSLSPTPLPTKYDVIDGLFDSDINLQSEDLLLTGLPKKLQGCIQISSQNGSINPLKDQSNITKGVVGLATAANAILGNQVKMIDTIGFFTSYFTKIPYNDLNIEVLRGKDCIVRLREASLTNDDLHIFAEGFLEQLPTEPFDQQPLEIDTHINVRQGPLLNYLAIDSDQIDTKGYFVGPQCALRGTISKLNYKDFMKLLKTPAPNDSPKEGTKGIIRNIFESIF